MMKTTALAIRIARYRGLQVFLISLLAFTLNNSCGSLISTYNHYAYTQTIDVKVELLYLMEQAVEPFELHEESIKTIQMKIEKVYEYEKGRPKNEITVAMWEKFKSPDRFLFGGFIKRWQTEETLSLSFIEESKKNIGVAIDQIIGLESGKIKKSELSF